MVSEILSVIYNYASSISIILILSIFFKSVFDAAASRLVGDKIIDRYWKRFKIQMKLVQQKYRTVNANSEFSIYVSSLNKGDVKNLIKSIKQGLRDDSGTEIQEINDNDLKSEFKLNYNGSSYRIQITPIRARSRNGAPLSEISSVGVNIDFDFEIQNLRDILLDLGVILESLKESFSSYTQNSRNTEYIISFDLGPDLDLEMTEDADIRLVVEKTNSGEEIRFHKDTATIRTTHPRIDRSTASTLETVIYTHYF